MCQGLIQELRRWQKSIQQPRIELRINYNYLMVGIGGDKRVARSLGRWRVVLASKSPETTSVQTVLAGKLCMYIALGHFQYPIPGTNSGCSPNRRTNPSISRDRRAECSATMIVSTSVPFPKPPAGPAGGTREGSEVLTIMVAEHSARLSRLMLGLVRRFGLHPDKQYNTT